MNEVSSLQSILDNLYGQMLPLFAQFTGIAEALGAMGALFFIAFRVWGHMARAEPVEVYPLLRPFALGMAIFFYNPLLLMLNGMLQPTVTGTAQILQGSNAAIATLLQERQDALQQGGTAAATATADNAGAGAGDATTAGSAADSLGGDLKFELASDNFSLDDIILESLSKFLEILYEGAALVISVIRTFILIVLSILGPLVIGLSVFDGFRNSLQHWLARYINVFLWLPVANIYGCVIGKVQELMLQQGLGGTASGATSLAGTALGSTASGVAAFPASGTIYILFLLMGIAGYCCVPGTAGYIVQAAGGHPLLSKINRAVAKIIQ